MHHDRKSLVRVILFILPSESTVKQNGRRIRNHYSKTGRLEAATVYFRFSMQKQARPDSSSSMLPPDPQIINPVIAGQHHPDNFLLYNSHPTSRPILLAYGKRRFRPESAIDLIHDCLYQVLNGWVIMKVRPSYDRRSSFTHERFTYAAV
jgi:hypothetical protein